MNINRHNYESFFLLYVDNELSAAERNAVDMFVQQNPDLKEELEHLQEAVIAPADIVFADKQSLLKTPDFAQLQEQLLLHLDGELNKADTKKIEQLIATDKSLAAEFSLLQKTRLEATAIEFTDKKSLYRHAERPVVQMKWWRVAAAALLLGFGVWTGITVYKNSVSKSSGIDVAKKKTNEQPAVQVPSVKEQEAPVIANTTGNQTTDPQAITNSTVQQKQSPVTPVVTNNNSTIPVVNKNQNTDKEQGLAQVPKPSNNLPKSYLENINNKERNETVSNNVSPVYANNNNNISGNNVVAVQNNKEKAGNNQLTDINTNAAENRNTAAIAAVYNPDAGAGNDRILNLDDDKSKHSKFGGFLRKVKRTLERTANIKTGDEVKVAGFEIAIK